MASIPSQSEIADHSPVGATSNFTQASTVKAERVLLSNEGVKFSALLVPSNCRLLPLLGETFSTNTLTPSTAIPPV